MDKMTQLLESLDPELFTKEFKDSLIAVVNEKTADATLELKEENEKRVLKLAEEYEEKITAMSADFEAKIQKASDTFEEKNATELKEFKDEVVSILDEYLEYVAEEIVKENAEPIMDKAIVDEAIEVHKIFDKTLQEYHINVNNIGVKISESEEIGKLKESLNSAVNEAVALRKEKEDALLEKNAEKRKAFVAEVANTINVLSDREKFTKIAEGFKEGDDFEVRVKELAEGYVKKDTKPAVVESTDLPTNSDPVVEDKTPVTEDSRTVALKEGFEKFFTTKKI